MVLSVRIVSGKVVAAKGGDSMSRSSPSEQLVPITAVEAMFGARGRGMREETLRYMAVPNLGVPLPLPHDALEVLSRYQRLEDEEEHIVVTCLSAQGVQELAEMYRSVLQREGMGEITGSKLPHFRQMPLEEGTIQLRFASLELGRGWDVTLYPEGEMTRSLVRTMSRRMVEMELGDGRRHPEMLELPQLDALMRSPQVTMARGGGSSGSDGHAQQSWSVETKVDLATIVSLVETSLIEEDVNVDELESARRVGVVFWSRSGGTVGGSITIVNEDVTNRYQINVVGRTRRPRSSADRDVSWIPMH
ncbi:hypothetical protein [Ferrimicrobium sp.]|uniref:hypothetical protein n=2 Tax=Ferrimicrobium sp. TaxID=2926050 RepID=UPI00261862BF|nr:hypothetical protein [Ferrimicrobium sp.]